MSAPNQLSFLPEDYLARKQQRRTNIICASLFVAVMGGIASAYFFTERMGKDVEATHTAVEAQYTEAAKRIAQVRQMQDKQRTMSAQAELTASLLERVPRSHLLAEITNAMPAGLSLLELNLDSKLRPPAPKPLSVPVAGAPSAAFGDAKSAADAAAARVVPEPRVYDVTLKLTGIAGTDVQVAGFMAKLGTSRLLSDVNLIVSDEFTQDGRKLRKFQIELVQNPAARIEAEQRQAQGAVGAGGRPGGAASASVGGN